MNYIKNGKFLGDVKPIVFLHGFNVHPNQQKEYLDLLSNISEVYSPIFLELNPMPSCIDEYVNETYEFLEKHNIHQYMLAGYSLGGGIATRICESDENPPDHLLLVNPLLPVDYGMLGYTKRGLEFLMNGNGNKAIANDFITNTKKFPYKSFRCLRDISKYHIKETVSVPTQIVLGLDDEFFSFDNFKKKTFNKFDDLNMYLIGGMNHNIVPFSFRVVHAQAGYLMIRAIKGKEGDIYEKSI